MAFVAERAAPYKRVRRVEFIDAVPEVGQRQDPAPRAAGPGAAAPRPEPQVPGVSAPPRGRARVALGRVARGAGCARLGSSPGCSAPSAGSAVCSRSGSVMAVLLGRSARAGARGRPPAITQTAGRAAGTCGSSARTASSSGSAPRAPGPVVDSAAAVTA